MLITDLAVTATLSTSGNAILPVKTALTSTTAALKLHAQLSAPGNGTSRPSDYRRSEVKILGAVSPFSINASDAPYQMRRQAFEIVILPSVEANNPTFAESELIVAAGSFLYTWLEVASYANPPTLSLKVVEIN